MQADLEAFAGSVPLGVTQSAPRTPEYRQQSGRTCFYASLIAAKRAINSGFTPSEGMIASEARQAGLLGPQGAETGWDNEDEQARFVRKMLGIDIRFIDTRDSHDADRVDALTHGLLEKHSPLVFGAKAHWLVLDGFRRRGEDLSWIGMDPALGLRLEDSGRELKPPLIAARLVDSGLPLVVVEGTGRPTPRFRPASHRARFSPADTQHRP